MPAFATLIVVCAMSASGKEAECEIVVHDKFRALSQPLCINQLERTRFKAADELMKRLKVYELLPGSHNCFNSAAIRDTTLTKVRNQFDKAGVAYRVTNKD